MSFQRIQFKTSSGEVCTATRNGNVVTIQGNKNGVRQMEMDEFMREFIKDQQKVNLERSPQADTVSFSGNKNVLDQKLGPAGFGPGHPQYEKKSKKGLWATLLILGGVGLYVLTRGRSGGKAVAGLTDDAVRAGKNVVTNVADDATKAGKKAVASVADDAVKAGEKAGNKAVTGAADDVSKATGGMPLTGLEDDAIDISRKGAYGQDIYDSLDPRNLDDVLSPYYQPKNQGMYGQNLDDMFDPMNKMDPMSQYYDPTGLGMF